MVYRLPPSRVFLPTLSLCFLLQPPTTPEEIASRIGDRADPEFEKEFLSNSDGLPDESHDALFKAF